MLTDPEFLKRLETLYLLTRKVLGGSMRADRRSTRKGSGINFADYAEYHYGDDYRHVDWNIYARLEALVALWKSGALKAQYNLALGNAQGFLVEREVCPEGTTQHPSFVLPRQGKSGGCSQDHGTASHAKMCSAVGTPSNHTPLCVFASLRPSNPLRLCGCSCLGGRKC